MAFGTSFLIWFSILSIRVSISSVVNLLARWTSMFTRSLFVPMCSVRRSIMLITEGKDFAALIIFSSISGEALCPTSRSLAPLSMNKASIAKVIPIAMAPRPSNFIFPVC